MTTFLESETSSDKHNELLVRLAACDTPCHVVDAEIVAKNINKLADYGRAHNLNVRPHTKTHKSKLIAKMQLDAGTNGLTVAKPGEAHVMAELGSEVLIAYPSITPASLQAIRDLSRLTRFMVALDSGIANGGSIGRRRRGSPSHRLAND
jgi:D-serine deaminase-like pyridoxal phosphate-dependent protein